MENRMKLLLSRMFRASFGSCRTRNTPDVIDKAVFVPQNQTHHFRVFEPPPPSSLAPPRPFPSISKHQIGPRERVSDHRYYSSFGLTDKCGGMCSPVSPISSFMYYKKERKRSKNQRQGSKHKSKKNKKLRVKSTNREARLLSSSSLDNSVYYSWLSSDDEDEADAHTLFSSRSTTPSSDSSGSLRRKRRSSRNRMRRRERVGSRSSEIVGVNDSFAVVKKSRDPYNDFRTSMVEMIAEKQIFGAKDLEKLLQLFISLNSDCHHRIIVEVFTEILEALSADWS